jgi:hypothetical protein
MVTSLQYLFQSEYRKKVKPGSKTDLLGKGFELLEQPFYSYIPLVLILLGGVKMAQIVAFLSCFGCPCKKTFLNASWPPKTLSLAGHPRRRCRGGPCRRDIVTEQLFAWQVWLMYCVLYELFELFWMFRPEALKELRRAARSSAV